MNNSASKSKLEHVFVFDSKNLRKKLCLMEICNKLEKKQLLTKMYHLSMKIFRLQNLSFGKPNERNTYTILVCQTILNLQIPTAAFRVIIKLSFTLLI